MRTRALPPAAAILALLFGAASAAAQTQPGAAQQIQPIAAPVALGFRSVERFRFAIEVANLGAPLPSSPMRIVAEGGGRVLAAGVRGTWDMAFDRLTLDGSPIAGAGPLALLNASVDTTQPHRVSYRADYTGIRTTPPGAGNAGIQMILGQIVDTAAYSLFVPPQAPVAERTPLVDLNAAMFQFLSYSRLGAQIVQPSAAATPVGLLDYHGRSALMVRQAGPMAVRIMNIDLPLQSEAVGIIDVATGMPLFVRGQLTGPQRLPFMNGAVHYLVRMASAIDGMPDPIAALQPLTPPPGQTPPPSAAAPMPAPAAMPPAAPPPMPMPAASAPRAAPATAPVTAPLQPAAPAAAQPPAGTSPATQQRLQTLKSLYDQGLITREQYDQRQREILANP